MALPQHHYNHRVFQEKPFVCIEPVNHEVFSETFVAEEFLVPSSEILFVIIITEHHMVPVSFQHQLSRKLSSDETSSHMRARPKLILQA